MNKLKTYIVIYRENEADIFAAPLLFRCDAEDPDHAEEQCLDACPDADVLWVFDGHDVDDALTDYYTITVL